MGTAVFAAALFGTVAQAARMTWPFWGAMITLGLICVAFLLVRWAAR